VGTPTRHTNLLIIGAGIAGTVLGVALARRGLACTIVDRSLSFRPQFRGEIIQPYGTLLLERLGLLEPIQSVGSARVTRFVSAFPMIDGQPRAQQFVDPNTRLSNYAATCRHHLLYGALRTSLKQQPDVELLEGWRVVRLSRQPDRRWSLEMLDPSGGRARISAGLVIGADGARSLLHSVTDFGVRSAEAKTWLLGAVDRTAAPGDDTFHFCAGRRWAAYLFPVGRGTRRVSVQLPSEAVPMDRGDRERAFARLLGDAALALGMETADTETVECLQAVPAPVLRTGARCRDGLCLIGDAVGTVNPITGHGLTLACHDAVVLAEAVAELGGFGVEDQAALAERLAAPDPYRQEVQRFSDLLVEGCFSRWSEGHYRQFAAGFGAIPRVSLLLEGAPWLEQLMRTQQRIGAVLAELSQSLAGDPQPA
jgi:squalene monooxygenase